MYCRKCGNELRENAVFCDSCGAKVEVVEETVVKEPEVVEEVATVVEDTPVVNKTQEPRGPWKAFATVGHILGIVSLSFVWFPYFVCCSIGVYGIVFSALGKKSIKNNQKAQKGLVMSIVATTVNFVLTILIYVIIILASEF